MRWATSAAFWLPWGDMRSAASAGRRSCSRSSPEPTGRQSDRPVIQTSGRAYGIALVAAATVLWSTAGLYVRLLDLDVWTIQAWRSLFAALSLFALVFVDKGRQAPHAVAAIGWPGLAAVPISAISMICYVAALKLTTVANVMIVYATVPFVAAG